MNAQLVKAYVGKAGLYHINGLKVEVSITDMRSVYGRLDVRIEPKAGSGAIWVSTDKITLL